VSAKRKRGSTRASDAATRNRDRPPRKRAKPRIKERTVVVPTEIAEHRGCLLSLDLASISTGWSFIRDGRLGQFGVASCPSGSPVLTRMERIYRAIGKAIEANKPDTIIVERFSGFHKGVCKRNILTLAWFQALVVGRLIESGWAIDENLHVIREDRWTQRRDKETRIRDARKIFPDMEKYLEFRNAGKDKGLDAADSIAMGVWWLTEGKASQEAEDSS
jgi:hypothetical protein